MVRMLLSSEAVPSLIAVLKDESLSHSLRHQAAAAIREIDDTSTRETLLQLQASAESPTVRSLAEVALGTIADRR